jgi:hypothetical protein
VQQKVKAVQGELVLVSRHARAKQACLNEQAAKQRVFLDVLHVVANAGFKQEVMVAFVLNTTAWNDESLWQTIVNDKYTAKRDGTTYKGTTRLIMHCEWGRDSSIFRTLRLKANVHAENERGESALLIACLKGRKDAARALIKASSKVNHVDKKGFQRDFGLFRVNLCRSTTREDGRIKVARGYSRLRLRHYQLHQHAPRRGDLSKSRLRLWRARFKT